MSKKPLDMSTFATFAEYMKQFDVEKKKEKSKKDETEEEQKASGYQYKISLQVILFVISSGDWS